MAGDRKRGRKQLLTHTYVIRTDRKDNVGPVKNTWHEYYTAVCMMIKDLAVPSSWVEHLEQTSIMAADWNWAERIFTMINDGRLPTGCKDTYCIKDMLYTI